MIDTKMTDLPTPTLAPYGDSAVYLKYDVNGYNPAAVKAVLTLAQALRSSVDWQDVVSGYDSLVAVFRPGRLTLGQAVKSLEAALKKKSQSTLKTRKGRADKAKVIEIPVYYGGEFGPDMSVITQSSGLSEAQVIKAHSARVYSVCMMGFIPGFAFLSEAPSALHHPRRETPRLSVPAGSIGIAGWQTGIYGLSSPGGWQIIGRTDAPLFDAKRDTPFLLSAGDKLRFVPASGAFPKKDEAAFESMST